MLALPPAVPLPAIIARSISITIVIITIAVVAITTIAAIAIVTITTISSIAAVPSLIVSIATLVPALSPASAASPHASSSSHTSTHASSHHGIRLWCGFLYINIMTIDCLFWGLEKVCDHRLLIEGDETESFALALLFVEWHLHFNNVTKLIEEVFDVIIRKFWFKATNKDFAMASLCLLWINFFAIYDVITRLNNLINSFSYTKDDKCKASGTASVWVCFNINAFNVSIFAEVFT